MEVKMKKIFKTFTITDNNSKVLVTLDTISEVSITIEGSKIILEIYDKQEYEKNI